MSVWTGTGSGQRVGNRGGGRGIVAAEDHRTRPVSEECVWHTGTESMEQVTRTPRERTGVEGPYLGLTLTCVMDVGVSLYGGVHGYS